MEFDIRTIFVILFLVSSLIAIMLLVFLKTQKTYAGFSLWTMGALLGSISYPLLILRDTIPEFFSVILANIIIITSFLFLVDGTSRFIRSKPLPVMSYSVLIPFTVIFLYFTYIENSIAVRGFVSAAVIVPFLIFAGFMTIHSEEWKNRYINYAFALVLCITALLYMLRAFYWLFVTEPSSIFSADNFSSIYFIFVLLVTILASGFFLMLNIIRAQTELIASEERYRILSDNLPEYVIVHDGEKILYANPASIQFTGIPEEKMLDMPIESFIAPDSIDQTRITLQKLRMKPGALQPHEIIILSPDGTKHTCIIKSVPVRYQNTRAILSVLSDITEYKKIEDSLRLANRKLNLLSGITRHDIKNQLMALNSYIYLTDDSIDDPAMLRDYFKTEQKITDTISRQINFTRDYEELGMNSPVWQKVNPLVQTVGSTLPVQNVKIDTDCPGLEIFADPLLEKVFYNLIDNSLRYGGETLTTIHISTRQSGENLHLLYEDNGEGISYKDKTQLFTKGFGKNTGLGLFLSREILSITGITITENGEPGKGACFDILIPKGTYRFTNQAD